MKTKIIILIVVLLSIGLYINNGKSGDMGSEDASLSEKTENSSGETSSTDPKVSPNLQTTQKSPTVSSTGEQLNSGRIVFGITDKAVGLEEFKSIFLTIGSVRIHHGSKGWITVSQTPRTFDLLKLRATSRNEVLADMSISADTYDAVRLVIDSILMTKSDGSVIEAKVPSKELKIDSNVKVFKGKISSVLLDFLADKSLHTTGDGKIIFAPVVAVETKSEITAQTVDVPGSLNKKVDLIGGNTNFTATIGMNEAGVVKVDTIIDPLATLEIVGDTIKLTPKK
jgi:hypothetical protein